MFKFKQFVIKQDKAAMKVGTDGVLLGAWASLTNSANVLDIGSGTGLLSIMAAQRSNANIIAIDVDKNAFLQTIENVNNSKWSGRVGVKHISFQNFLLNNEDLFDYIICNPPFFSNSLRNENKSKSLARHNDKLPFSDLIKGVASILSNNGKFGLILPYSDYETIISLASENGMFVINRLNIKPTNEKDAKRVLLEFSKKKLALVEKSIVIEVSRHVYTDDYISLTKDFYLDF